MLKKVLSSLIATAVAISLSLSMAAEEIVNTHEIIMSSGCPHYMVTIPESVYSKSTTNSPHTHNGSNCTIFVMYEYFTLGCVYGCGYKVYNQSRRIEDVHLISG